MSTSKTSPLSRNKQWTVNSLNRRKAIVAEGGRLLPVLLESYSSEKLDEIIRLRKKANPTISMTGWVKLMIEADFKQLQRRRAGTKGARSTVR
jgi:hypothetical protein